MSAKTVVITGCSSGIGLHAAVEAARAGHTVVATMRNLERRAALDEAASSAGVELDVRTLDITDVSSVTECVAGILADHGSIDTLINNAGAGFVGTLEQTSTEELQRTMDVNFTGHIHMTRAVMPSMRAQGSGHIVSVTSVGGVVGQPFNDAYCAAKFATEGFMQSLAPVARHFGINVSVVEPGPVGSEFVANVTESVEHLLSNDEDPYRDLFAAYFERTKGAFADAQDPADVGRLLAEITTSGQDAAFRIQTTPRAEAFAGMSLSDVDGSNVQNATRMWVGTT